jgi:hypothetical protein
MLSPSLPSDEQTWTSLPEAEATHKTPALPAEGTLDSEASRQVWQCERAQLNQWKKHIAKPSPNGNPQNRETNKWLLF